MRADTQRSLEEKVESFIRSCFPFSKYKDLWVNWEDGGLIQGTVSVILSDTPCKMSFSWLKGKNKLFKETKTLIYN